VANKGLRAYGTWKSIRKTGRTEETAERNEEVNSRKLKVERKKGFNTEITEDAECAERKIAGDTRQFS
jgi:hypothetical protein